MSHHKHKFMPYGDGVVLLSNGKKAEVSWCSCGQIRLTHEDGSISWFDSMQAYRRDVVGFSTGEKRKRTNRPGAAVAVLALAVSAQATTYTVCVGGSCDPYTSINAAITAASCGDTIQVKVGGGGGTSGEHLAGDGVSAPISLKATTCAVGNEITITTDQTAKLPAANQLITPAYADGASRVVPRITSVGNGRLLEAVFGASHAKGYKLIGLEFFCGGTAIGASPAASPCIGVGWGPSGTSEVGLDAVSDLPENITFDRVTVRNDPTLNSSPQPFVFDPNGGTLMNSWISGGTNHASDSQGVWMASAQNVTIRNNYISGHTESLGLQGGCSPLHDNKGLGPEAGECVIGTTTVPTNITVEHNEITHEPWQYNRPWTASWTVSKGQWTQLSTWAVYPSPLCRFQAQNAGTTGGTEPTWTSIPTLGDSLVDGTVTWMNTGICGGTKNLFESKASNGLTLRHNSLHGSYYSPRVEYGSQGSVLTLTTRTNSPAGAGTSGVINNTVIGNNVARDAGYAFNLTSVDTYDPNVYPGVWPSNAPTYVISTGSNDALKLVTTHGGSCTVTLTAGTRTADQIVTDIVGSACNTIVWACNQGGRPVVRASADGSATCASGAGASNPTYSDSITVDTVANNAAATLGFTTGAAHYSCEHPDTGVWYGCGKLDGIVIRNNLFAGLNKSVEYNNERLYFLMMNGRPDNLEITNNTFDSVTTNWESLDYTVPSFFMFDNNGTFAPYLPKIHSNLVKHNGLYATVTNTEGLGFSGIGIYDFSSINYSMCQTVQSDRTHTPDDVICAATEGVFSHNLLTGSTLHSASTMDTRPYTDDSGLYKIPNNNYNDAASSVAYADAANFRLATYSSYPTVNKFMRNSLAGGAIGADQAQLPLINGLTIRPSDRAAVASFTVTNPVASFPCVARVSTDAKMLSTAVPIPILADLDPSLYTRPDSSDADWLPKTGLQRWFVFGRNVALTAATTYYYHLNCGGAYASGSFATTAADAGSRAVKVSRTPTAAMGSVASCLIESGTAYSRATDTITGSSASGACTAGNAYSTTVSASRGTPLYLRMRYRDAGDNVLASDPVTVIVP